MIVARFRGVGLPVWIPDWLLERLAARDEHRARLAAAELSSTSRPAPAPRRVVCPSCGEPFTRHGAAASSSHFYRTREENDTCIVCREGLDPTTLEPMRREGEPMKPERLSDDELIEALEGAAPRLRLARLDELRRVADAIAGVALEAAARFRTIAGDRPLLELRERASRLEDAAFHFQTCSTCRREGEGACSTGARFAAFLRGELEQRGPAWHLGAAAALEQIEATLLEALPRVHVTQRRAAALAIIEKIQAAVDELEAGPAPPVLGKIRDVSIGPDGTLTARLEVNDGGRKLLDGIRRTR